MSTAGRAGAKDASEPPFGQALDGIRVLDLSTALGEATGRSPRGFGRRGDQDRAAGRLRRALRAALRHDTFGVVPPPTAPGGDPEQSLFWRAFGLGKRSVVLDLEADADRERFLALVGTADILLESSTPGELDALGLGYDALAARNPALLYVSITPFGQTAPPRGSPPPTSRSRPPAASST